MKRGKFAALFAISAASLLLELYWLRYFAEAEWGHLASMVVSTAMLGIGAGGILVLLCEPALMKNVGLGLPLLLVGFVSTAGTVPALVALLPLEPMMLAWRFDAWSWVFMREVAVAIPFVFGAAAITLFFRLECHQTGRVYAFNLLGAAAGVATTMVLTRWLPTELLNAAAIFSGGVALALSRSGASWRATVMLTVSAWAWLARSWSVPLPDPTKDLSAALRLPQVEVLSERPGTAGRWTMLTSPALHLASGLSLLHPEPVSGSRAIFLRGDAAGAVLPKAAREALRHRVNWLPYVIRTPRSVLVLGEAGALEIQAADLADAKRVVALVSDPRTRDALHGELGRYAGLADSGVELRGGSVRAALSRLGAERFDVVVIAPGDSLTSATAGLGATTEDYLLTVEGVREALAGLASDGVLVIQRWTDAPPRDLPRLLGTVTRATSPSDSRSRLALIRNWDAWTLVVSRRPLDPADHEAIREFAATHAFDVLLPRALEEPPIHHLPGPAPGPMIETVLGSAGLSLPRSPFSLAPATDDRPYFHHFLDYRRPGAYLSLLRDGSLPLSAWGDLFLWAGLLSAVLLGGLLVALPPILAAGPRRILTTSPADTVLFTALGLGYMFLEMTFLHQGTRVFGSSTPSAALTVGAFLLGSGIGAGFLNRLGERSAAGPIAAFLVSASAIVVALGLEAWLEQLGTLSPVVAACGFFAPAFLIAIPLGMPFPAGLARAARSPSRIPWLMAMNGWASVVGAVAASLVAVTSGFSTLGLAASSLYATAGIILLRGAAREP